MPGSKKKSEEAILGRGKTIWEKHQGFEITWRVQGTAVWMTWYKHRMRRAIVQKTASKLNTQQILKSLLCLEKDSDYAFTGSHITFKGSCVLICLEF